MSTRMGRFGRARARVADERATDLDAARARAALRLLERTAARVRTSRGDLRDPGVRRGHARAGPRPARGRGARDDLRVRRARTCAGRGARRPSGAGGSSRSCAGRAVWARTTSPARSSAMGGGSLPWTRSRAPAACWPWPSAATARSIQRCGASGSCRWRGAGSATTSFGWPSGPRPGSGGRRGLSRAFPAWRLRPQSRYPCRILR